MQCSICGAPDDGNSVVCAFCGQAVSPEAQATAVQCRTCGLANRAGKEHCVKCKAWLVVSCVFCGQLSPCNLAACASCHEAFAGSSERKQERDRQKAMDQTLSTVGSVVSMLAGGSGAVGGTAATLASATKTMAGEPSVADGDAPRMPPF